MQYNSYTKNYQANTYVLTCVPCTVCKKSATVEVPAGGMYDYNQGALIQDAFPTLSQAERELLLTGTHSACWDTLWEEEG